MAVERRTITLLQAAADARQEAMLTRDRLGSAAAAAVAMAEIVLDRTIATHPDAVDAQAVIDRWRDVEAALARPADLQGPLDVARSLLSDGPDLWDPDDLRRAERCLRALVDALEGRQ